MNVTWLLAWRNLWRHSRRTWLTVSAMVFCNVLMIFMISLQLGSYDMMINNSLAMATGHLQVQHRDYLQDSRMRDSVPAAETLAQQLRDQPDIDSAAARGQAFALASSEERSFGVLLVGVEPGFEAQVSTLPGLVGRGRFLQEADSEAIVIGAVLARNLKIDLGGELTFLGSGRDGSFAAGIATVVGILETGIDEIDRSVAQVPLHWFQDVFAMGDHGHMVVARAPLLDDVPTAVQESRALLPKDGALVVQDWDALQPGLRQAIQSDMASAWFMYAVFILLVAFSVLNTQLMSVLERTREFGVMMALGMSPGNLARLVTLETFLMSLLGLGIGLVAGGLLTWYLSHAGFTYPGMEEMAARFNMDSRMYPQLSPLALLWGPVTVFLFTMLATVYPSLRLYKLEPVTAMRAA